MSDPEDKQVTQVEGALYKALLDHVSSSGRSMNAIGQLSGVHASTICRIVSGNRAGVGLHTAGLLCKYLGLKLGKPQPKNPAIKH